MSLRFVLLQALLAASLAGCVGDDLSTGGQYSQCVGASKRGPLGGGAFAFAPDVNDLQCWTSRTFEVAGKSVTLEYFAYGEVRDCPSGCFSSHACAIVEGQNVSLFDATWYAPEETPKQLAALCPNLGDANTTDGCQLPARSHPVTQLAAFQQLASSQEVFRYCF